MSRYESRTRFNGNRGRKSGATFKWKKSPSNKSKRKSGEYNHVDVEQEMLQSNQLNKEENKANNVDDDDDEDRSNYVIKKGIYYHHDRQKKKYSNNFDGMYNNNNNYRRKDKENINRNNAGLMRKNGKELKKSKLTRVNRRGMVYSNDFERGLLESRKSRKRNKIPMPYPPNYPNKNDTYEQPYIDSPPTQGRRRQQRSGQRYYNKYGQQAPRTSAQALMQLRYEAQNAATTAQALYEQEYRNVNIGTYLDDGSWYPFPDPRLRGVKDTRKKPPKIQKPPPVKFDAQYVYDPLTPGQKVNRVQNTLEYYFSEANMLYDNHLRSLCDAEGWVNVKKLENFPRMIKFGAKADIIIEAAYHSNFIEVKNNKYIRMKVGWEKYIPDHLKKKINKTNKINKNKSGSNSNNNNNNNNHKKGNKDKIKKDIKALDPSVDLNNLPTELNEPKSAVTKKDIRKIVKAIEQKDNKYKERQQKKKKDKSVKDDSKETKNTDVKTDDIKDKKKPEINGNSNSDNIKTNKTDKIKNDNDPETQAALKAMNDDGNKKTAKSKSGSGSDGDTSEIDVD